jgi:hypothetical protein
LGILIPQTLGKEIEEREEPRNRLETSVSCEWKIVIIGKGVSQEPRLAEELELGELEALKGTG